MVMPAAAQNDLLENYAMLQYKIKALQSKIEEFQSGKRYLKLQEDHRRVITGYIRENKKLKQELEEAHAETKRVLDIWSNQCSADWDDYRKKLDKKEAEIRKLKDKYWNQVRTSDEKIDSITELYEERIAEKDAVIEALKAELAHKEALLNRDSTNTSLPTGQTPPGKEKRVPNGRQSSGKPKGGQPGHDKHTLEKPPMEEVNDTTDHELDGNEACPTCGSENFTYTGEYEEKYEYDIAIKVIKRLHKYWLYSCDDCGEIIRAGIAPKLRAECQYGAGVQALSLSLMNTANAAINKVPMLISGLTEGELHPSEGYIAKLQKRAAENLMQFRKDLRMLLIKRALLYWDDTVVRANKKRICLRFYGDETIAYYVAHEKKDMEGILDDNILQMLAKETKVMHDHNTVNYNPLFAFINLECNTHLQRDLQKSADDTGHMVLIEIKNLISQTMKDRNDLKRAGVAAFDDAYIEVFNRNLTELLSQAENLAAENTSKYSGPDERALVARIIKYRENFFAWVKDFSLPTTNNLSERSLRGVKTKMKVSGQFASVETADYYAVIRSYIETCRRNKINEMDALMRLCSGNPYTVAELFS